MAVCRVSVTCSLKLVQSDLDLLLEFFRGEDEAVPERHPLLLQHDAAVDQDLLEVQPLVVQSPAQLLHLGENKSSWLERTNASVRTWSYADTHGFLHRDVFVQDGKLFVDDRNLSFYVG